MKNSDGLLSKIEILLVSIPAFLALCLVAHQAFARYFFPGALVDWAEEITVYLIMWAVFLSLGKASAQGSHIKTELLLAALPDRLRLALEIVLDVIAILFILWLGYYAWEVAFQAYSYDDRTSSSLRLPIWIYYASLPVGCAGMAIGFSLHLAGLLTSISDRKDSPS